MKTSANLQTASPMVRQSDTVIQLLILRAYRSTNFALRSFCAVFLGAFEVENSWNCHCSYCSALGMGLRWERSALACSSAAIAPY